MDRYEYKLKTEQMLELMESGAYKKAADIAGTIDWKRVKNTTMLTEVSDIYEKAGDLQKSYEVLNIAYHRAQGGSRKIIYRICALALKTGNVDQAIDYYDDFIQVAPKDPNQHILKYKILRARRAPLEQQIEALEEFKRAEYIEEWAYELAKLYQEAGMTVECLEECDDLILWFSEGRFVFKAMELKMLHKQLTPQQKERYDRRFENIGTITEDIPGVTEYQIKKGVLSQSALENQNVQEERQEEDLEKSSTPQFDKMSEDIEGAAEPPDESVLALEKKGIGSRMKLEDALQSLLTSKNEVEEEKSGTLQDEAQQEIPEFEMAIEEIESVIDLNLIKELSDKQEKGIQFDKDLEELRVAPEEPIEQVASEVLTERIDTPVSAENKRKHSSKSAHHNQVAGQISVADILACREKENNPEEEDKMENKKKVVEPSLPADIQKLIDEIEGILPEEIEEKPVHPPTAKEDDSVVNMGQVTEQLRIDDIEEFMDDSDNDAELTEDATLDDYEEELEEESDLEESEEEETDIDDYEEDLEEESDLEESEEEETDIDDYEEDLEEEPDLEESEEEETDIDDYEEELEEEPDLEELEEEEPDLDDYEEDLEEEPDLEESEEEKLAHESEGEIHLEEYEEEELDDDREGIEASFEEEFRPNPKHAQEPDDREIPDEDKGMNILSETTPLSRKETAKMIATGKTAPLPVDEISNALSISDTGFVVHGRYDLETQSGVGTRAGLTEEQKKLFSYFVPVRGMSEQLVDVLEQDRNCTNRKGTSSTGNLLIIGNKGNGKTVLAVDVVKAIQKQRNIRHGKVAIVTGDSLNKKKITDIFGKLHGGALIIEKAGKMNEKTVARLNKAMERDSGELLLVLEEQRKPLDRLLSSNRDFRRKFTSRLEVPIFINDELVTFGQTYAKENGYHIDEMGILALYSRIDALQREDHAVTVAEVKEIMDEAMEHSQKASAKKLVKRVLGKNTDDSDRILLSEKDFNL